VNRLWKSNKKNPYSKIYKAYEEFKQKFAVLRDLDLVTDGFHDWKKLLFLQAYEKFFENARWLDF